MKKIILSISIALIFILPSWTEASSAFNQFGVRNVELFNQVGSSQNTEPIFMPEKTITDLNKKWTVTFSGDTVSEDKIAGMVIAHADYLVPVSIEILPQTNQAVITPLKSYEPGESYTLVAILENGLVYELNFKTEATPVKPETIGNTYGNLSNVGLVAEANGWIYFVQSNEHAIYRMKTDGSNKERIFYNESIKAIHSLNINGDSIYFVALVEGYSTILKMDTEEQSAHVVRYSNEPYETSYYEFNQLLVTDNAIFTNFWDGYDFNLEQYDLDGDEMTTRIRTSQSNATFYKDVVVSRNILTDTLEIYHMTKDEVIYSDISNPYHINIENDWIYYINASDYSLNKLKIDGSNARTYDVKAISLNVKDDWIYYISPDDYSIHKMHVDGTKQSKLSDSQSKLLYVTDDWIFYIDEAVQNLYRMKHDGSQFTLIK